MLISWNWLKQYVLLDMPIGQLEQRLMMAGLNHEETNEVDGDFQIDLEVTSNRPDCLGHIGIAREVATLWGREIHLPPAAPQAGSTPVSELTAVDVQAPDLCPRYTARVIRGVSIGPSPAWLARRLNTIGVATINNVVDITNYVLFECGQPLHAFDYAKLAGQRIIVRRAKAGEKIEAINHQTYELQPEMCVIADAQRPVALAGIMGGADTEVSESTTDLLIEAAVFDPLSIRQTRFQTLKKNSPSSYRFERGLDPEGVDWASRRCCELVLDLAGGELASGVVDVGQPPPAREPIVLRYSQLQRVLGITIDPHEVRRILKALGNGEQAHDAETIRVVPPSWRSDLTREIDLVEEVARVHGYESIPENVIVPLGPSRRTTEDRVLDRVRQTLTALGYDEIKTLSAIDPALTELTSPWTGEAPLQTATSVIGKSNLLRRTLIPSLLSTRRYNETQSNETIELFETAKVYWPKSGGLPQEPWMLGLCSGGDFLHIKGAAESLLDRLKITGELQAKPCDLPLFVPERGTELYLNDQLIGYVGEVSEAIRDQLKLQQPCSVLELRLEFLLQGVQLIPQYVAPSPFPPSSRDLNMVVAEGVLWSEVARLASNHGGPLLTDVKFQETYRSEQIGAGKKSLLFSLTFRSREGTLTSDEVERHTRRIIEAIGKELGGQLRG